ncbi:MAG: AAA family ATPase [Candidatus Sungbacteria bacterium]|nr:AAA family ATPase [Candidatus Sungbacteria bacterium]
MRRSLTSKEVIAEYSFLAALRFPRRKTKRPVVVAMIGLVGFGKNTVARVLSREIGAVVIEGDAIRVALRKTKSRYEAARRIAEHAAIETIQRGSNVVIDSDFADSVKRREIEKVARGVGARVVFVRVVCHPDIAIGRILSTKFQSTPDDFFGGASSAWHGDKRLVGIIVKLREMWRRTPHHYTWSRDGGGAWKLKKIPQVFATIDATDPGQWRREVRKIAYRLR